MAYIVQPSHYPLPDTYLPIFPCRLGSREPLVPDFEWPFGECVVNTSRSGKFFFNAVVDPSEGVQRWISDASRRLFDAISLIDTDAHINQEIAMQLAEREAAGVDEGDWTAFSRKSTLADVHPGHLFAPTTISGQIRYDIESMKQILPASRCMDEVRQIKILRARFSRPQTERTILWTLDHASCSSGNLSPERPSTEFQNPALFDLSVALERPRTPSISGVHVSAADEEDDDDDWGDRWLRRIAKATVPRAPFFQPYTLKVMYFDIFGTLIDHESGIFKALEPLLSRSSYGFVRNEALSFYSDVETEVKKRSPRLPYVQILARAYADMAMRLGLTCTDEESFVFACSLFKWRLFDDAVPTLQALRPFVPALIGLVDMDFEVFSKTAAFEQLTPYLETMSSWDHFHVYRPDPAAVYPPLMFHDSIGIPRSHRCFVSDALFRDLEPACCVDIPAIWLRRPGTLAANLPTNDASFVWRICEGLPDLVSAILAEKGAPRRVPTNLFDVETLSRAIHTISA
ncbi:HAD-like domain-containing protein [Mycena polygramma]|nr:HAD-like domain-containing protein [Mycena polygramma]